MKNITSCNLKWPGIPAVVFLLAVLLTGCATIRTGSHHDPAESFDSYQTFAWIADDPLIGGANTQPPISPLSKKIVVQAIESELIKKGFVLAGEPKKADFVVSYTVGTREKIEATSYPRAYRGAWGWHLYGRYYYQTEVSHRSYTEGTLGIDIFDGTSKEPVWHGWATKTISSKDKANPAPNIQKAVAGIIARFPPNT